MNSHTVHGLAYLTFYIEFSASKLKGTIIARVGLNADGILVRIWGVFWGGLNFSISSAAIIIHLADSQIISYVLGF